MVCTTEALNSVLAAAPLLPLDPDPGVVVSPGIPGILKPDGVGVAVLAEPPQPARAATAAMEMAPRMTGFADMTILDVVRQRSLRAESPPMISRRGRHSTLLPNRETEFTLVQSI
jgi:hypothetical protein